MMGAGLGLGGLGGIERKEAEAGIVTSFSVDPQIQALGAQYAVSNGGSVGYIANNGQTVSFGSGVHLGGGWVGTAGHVVLLGGALSFGTGTNFNTDPGTVHLPSQVIIHPLYLNGGNRNHDLALIKYPTLNSSATLTLPFSKPAAGSDVWLAGFGMTGTPAGYTTQGGFIRAGTSRLSNGSGLASKGYSNIYHGAADMKSTTRPLDIRAYIGNSGGGVFDQSGGLIGIIIAGGNSPSNGRTYFLDLTNT